jgi:hypothetical protein
VEAFWRVFWGRWAFFDNFGSLGEFGNYWRTYGGLGAVLSSPNFIISLVLTAAAPHLWQDGEWFETSFSILPNLLGFTIGALAIVLAFPTTAIFKVIAEEGRDDSYYMDTAARFVHFTVIQVIALLLALMGKAFPGAALAFAGTLFLIYSITTAVMTALNFFFVAQIYNKYKPPGDH